KYFFFEKRFSYALRLFGGTIMGDTNSRFYLDYFNGIRGFNDDKLKGKNKAVLSSELRFPFIDNLKMAFPLPLWFYSIRGSIFADVGAVWNDTNDFQPMHKDRFKDLVMGFGFGPRINLTYFVLKFDVAWHTNLIQISKPSFYLSLSPDF
ncbi:MAG: BamA/TamA family outer membrane protein, partial [Candidatus Cloacimonetes bacterium]|nr:BamA/TamA family outer membrane protein [Candidatus Cloacimonadota bacterium]